MKQKEKPLNSSTSRKDIPMKKLTFALFLGILAFIPVQAQTVVVQRPGIFTDLANATGLVLSLPFTLAEGVVVGSAEAVGSILHGPTEIIVVPSATPVPTPVVVTSPLPARPFTTIITTYEDGSVMTVTRNVSAYELGPVILTPTSPSHRVGSSPHINQYVYRYR